jgi:hypothetical protein
MRTIELGVTITDAAVEGKQTTILCGGGGATPPPDDADGAVPY